MPKGRGDVERDLTNLRTAALEQAKAGGLSVPGWKTKQRSWSRRFQMLRRLKHRNQRFREP